MVFSILLGFNATSFLTIVQHNSGILSQTKTCPHFMVLQNQAITICLKHFKHKIYTPILSSTCMKKIPMKVYSSSLGETRKTMFSLTSILGKKRRKGKKQPSLFLIYI